MNKLIIPVINDSNNELPEYKNPGDAGMDVRAWIENPIVIPPFKRVLINTGLKMAIPFGYECQVRPRSGLALKNGITVLNTPGTIDGGYRNYIGVILINLSDEPFTVNPGDRIAQLVFTKFEEVKFNLVETLDETERGEGGFGHTGVN